MARFIQRISNLCSMIRQGLLTTNRSAQFSFILRPLCFPSHVNDGYAVRESAVGHPFESDFLENLFQAVRAWEHANGFGQIRIGMPGSTQHFSYGRHDVEGIKVIEKSKPRSDGF